MEYLKSLFTRTPAEPDHSETDNPKRARSKTPPDSFDASVPPQKPRVETLQDSAINRPADTAPEKGEKWFIQGDLNALKQLGLKQAQRQALGNFVGADKSIRNVPGTGNCWVTASNYAFLTELRDMPPEKRQQSIANLENKNYPVPAYTEMLKQIGGHLSDDQIMSLITSPEYFETITSFTRSLPNMTEIAKKRDAYGGEDDLAAFSKAVGIELSHRELALLDTNVVYEETKALNKTADSNGNVSPGKDYAKATLDTKNQLMKLFINAEVDAPAFFAAPT